MPTSPRINWTRDHLLVALNLYHKVRFGQISARLPAIMEVAEKLGRTSASVSMKLGNLASFDPVLQLRGIKGLQGASRLDRETWDEYHTNPADLIPIAQEKFDHLFTETEDETTEVIPDTGIRRVKRPFEGATQTVTQTKARRGQDYFRNVVLNNYGGSCGVTGLPLRQLLIASHILPWSDHEAERLNVRNGICMNRLHDAAFDQGLIAFDQELRLILTIQLRSVLPAFSVEYHFEAFEGRSLILPDDGITPDPSFLESHRKRFGFT